MNTKDFIKVLQQEDPEGTCEVVINNQAISGIIKNPGYYDGAYWIALDKEGNSTLNYPDFIKKTAFGSKVQISTWDPEDIVFESVYANYSTLEDIKKIVLFDDSSSAASEQQKKEARDKFYDRFRSIVDEAVLLREKMLQEFAPKVEEMLNTGDIVYTKSKWYKHRPRLFKKQLDIVCGHVSTLLHLCREHQVTVEEDGDKKTYTWSK